MYTYSSRCLSTGDIQSPIACIHCHPRISNFLVVAFTDGTLLSFSPLSSTEPISQTSLSIPEACPLSICFGSGVGSDQFALYVLYSTGDIGIVFPFAIEGYQLPIKAYASLIKEGHNELNEWLYSWEQCNEKCMRSVLCRKADMPFVVVKQLDVKGELLDVKGKPLEVHSKPLDASGKPLEVNSKPFDYTSKQLSTPNIQLGTADKQPANSPKQSGNLPSTYYHSGRIQMSL